MISGAVVLSLAAFATAGAAQAPADEAALTYDLAKQAAEAAEVEARANDWNVTIVVADASGIPVYLKRLTGASTRSYEIAMGKARTSALTGLSTQQYGERLEAGQVEEVPNGINFPGGIPIVIDGEVVGAVGTSGVRALDDAQISQAGADAVTASGGTTR
ncbi:MAG: heme-binding protein [Gemmatimonadota bacterium]